MVKTAGGLLAAGLFGLTAPALAAGADVLGDHPDSCRPAAAGTAALVTVHGFKDRHGRLRVQSYHGTRDEYLASGRYLTREEFPLTAGGDISLCLPLPGPGRYALVALHDRDSNGKLSVWSDGVGFSRNPRLGLSKPAAETVLINVGEGITPVRIVLNYRHGLSVRPMEAP